jgi:lysophospholipase L1-like esterase
MPGSSGSRPPGDVRAGRATTRAVAVLATVLALALLGAPPLPEPGRDVQRPGPTRGAVQVPPTSRLVVALGDSVPSGAACGCTPFPTSYGAMLSARDGVPVTVRNFAANGLTTFGLLTQLREPSVAENVARARVVLLTIGANDFEDHHDQVVAGDCDIDAPSDCVGDELDSMRTRLATILAQVRALRRGAPTTVLVTGYWNVFEDGDVAQQASGTTGLQASIALTRSVNAVIRTDAAESGAYYVDLFAPFQRFGRGITALLAPDGNHPDAAGHRLIAKTLLDVGLPRADWR